MLRCPFQEPDLPHAPIGRFDPHPQCVVLPHFVPRSTVAFFIRYSASDALLMPTTGIHAEPNGM